MARPRLEIDPKQVELLAGVGCTVAEIAATLGVSKRSIETRFCALIETGREKMRGSLRRKQVELAMKGDRTMLIWLGKQLLGQRDESHVDANVAHTGLAVFDTVLVTNANRDETKAE